MTVSVVIPFYNGAAIIERALRSLETQTRPPAEVIIVDDGSPEPLPQIRSPLPIRHLRHDSNRGIPGARNTGIRAATSTWIAFLDQDDEWVPDKLERQLEVAGASGSSGSSGDTGSGGEAGGAAPVVFGRLLHTGSNREPFVWPPAPAVPVLEEGGDQAMSVFVRRGNAAPIVTLLVPRRAFERYGLLDEGLRGGGDDFELLLRLVSEGVPLRYDRGGAHGYSAVHHFTGRNYSGHAPRFLEDALHLVPDLAARYPLVRRHEAPLLARAHYGLGRHHHRSGERARAIERYRQAARLDPRWLRPYLARVALRLPPPLIDLATRLREKARGRF